MKTHLNVFHQSHLRWKTDLKSPYFIRAMLCWCSIYYGPVCHKLVFYWNGWMDRAVFLAQRLPSTYPTLYYNSIRVSWIMSTSLWNAALHSKLSQFFCIFTSRQVNHRNCCQISSVTKVITLSIHLCLQQYGRNADCRVWQLLLILDFITLCSSQLFERT